MTKRGIDSQSQGKGRRKGERDKMYNFIYTQYKRDLIIKITRDTTKELEKKNVTELERIISRRRIV